MKTCMYTILIQAFTQQQSLRLARCALGANELSQLLVALHAAALLPTATSSSSKQGGLRALSLEGNPALGEYGVQVRIHKCIT